MANEYEIVVGEHRLGEARVWSRGAFRAEEGSETRTLIEIGFVVRNASDTALHFDEEQLFLDEVVLSDRTEYHVTPLRIEGTTSIPPTVKQELSVVFSVPGGPSPSDVRSYRVAWTVRNGEAYRQRTSFVAAAWQPPYSPYDIYYDDYYYAADPWWPGYYVWPIYPVPDPGWRYWRAPYPLGPIPPSYMRSRHR